MQIVYNEAQNQGAKSSNYWHYNLRRLNLGPEVASGIHQSWKPIALVKQLRDSSSHVNVLHNRVRKTAGIADADWKEKNIIFVMDRIQGEDELVDRGEYENA